MQGCSGDFSQNILPSWHRIFDPVSFMSATYTLNKSYNTNITINSASVLLPWQAWSYMSQDVSVLREPRDPSCRVIEGTEEDLSIKYSNKHPQT